MKLDNKVALITGAARGIGYAIAKRYVEAGGRVVIADLDAKTASESAATLGGKDRAIGIKMNVTSEDEVNAGVAEAVKAFGTIDTLVSNAGIQIVHPIEKFPFADWKKLLAIHLDGAFLDHEGGHPPYVQAGLGFDHLYGLGPFQGGIAAQVGLCDRQARPARARPCYRQGRRRSWCARKRHMSGLRQDAAGRKADPGTGEDLGISEEDVVNKIMLGDTVDHTFTTVEDVAELALLFASFPTNALTGQSVVASHGWYMN